VTCPVCAGSGALLKAEERERQSYRIFRCGLCHSIWCPDHYAGISPDYIDREAADITPFVKWLQGEHKHAAFRQLFDSLDGPVNSVLDVGCGTGGFLAYGQARGVKTLYGFDASRAQVEVARTVSPLVRQSISIADYIRQLGHVPRLDLITLWDVIEHIREPRGLLSELRDYCDPNTCLFLSTPNGINAYYKLHLRRALSVPHSFEPWEHVLYYSPDALRRMLEEHGFQVIHSTGVVCYPRRFGAFEAVRRCAFMAARRTPLAPQLFVLARRASRG
jgi:2-polyprenyl-3-methyl-5-hydroxy-6-metoxy-1,4-benzoquinol methylase